jgi:hypothetical protein
VLFLVHAYGIVSLLPVLGRLPHLQQLHCSASCMFEQDERPGQITPEQITEQLQANDYAKTCIVAMISASRSLRVVSLPLRKHDVDGTHSLTTLPLLDPEQRRNAAQEEIVVMDSTPEGPELHFHAEIWTAPARLQELRCKDILLNSQDAPLEHLALRITNDADIAAAGAKQVQQREFMIKSTLSTPVASVGRRRSASSASAPPPPPKRPPAVSSPGDGACAAAAAASSSRSSDDAAQTANDPFLRRPFSTLRVQPEHLPSARIIQREQQMMDTNLDAFLTRPASVAALKSFKYEVHTVPTPASMAAEQNCQLAFPSQLFPGKDLLTVRVVDATKSASAHYAGYVLPEALADQYDVEYYHPSQMSSKTLSYTEPSPDGGPSRKVNVTFVGSLVRSFGPNINDIRGLSPTVRRRSCFVQHVEQPAGKDSLIDFKKDWKPGDKKIQVPDNFVTAHVDKENLRDGVELTMDYGELFWKKQNAADADEIAINTYCDRCLSKLELDADNQLVCCDMDGCMRARHPKCFDPPLPPNTDIAKMPHHCDLHKFSRPARAAASKKRSVEATPYANFPSEIAAAQLSSLSNESDAQQVWVDSADTATLDTTLNYNLERLQLRLENSTIPKAGKGCFTKVAVEAGTELAWAFGRFFPNEMYQDMVNDKYPDQPMLDGKTEDYTAPAAEGVWRALHANMSDKSEEFVLVLSHTCPVAYINNDDKKANVKINVPSKWTMQRLQGGGTQEMYDWKAMSIVATKRIEAGAELFLSYRYAPEAWRSQRKLALQSKQASLKRASDAAKRASDVAAAAAAAAAPAAAPAALPTQLPSTRKRKEAPPKFSYKDICKPLTPEERAAASKIWRLQSPPLVLRFPHSENPNYKVYLTGNIWKSQEEYDARVQRPRTPPSPPAFPPLLSPVASPIPAASLTAAAEQMLTDQTAAPEDEPLPVSVVAPASDSAIGVDSHMTDVMPVAAMDDTDTSQPSASAAAATTAVVRPLAFGTSDSVSLVAAATLTRTGLAPAPLMTLSPDECQRETEADAAGPGAMSDDAFEQADLSQVPFDCDFPYAGDPDLQSGDEECDDDDLADTAATMSESEAEAEHDSEDDDGCVHDSATAPGNKRSQAEHSSDSGSGSAPLRTSSFLPCVAKRLAEVKKSDHYVSQELAPVTRKDLEKARLLTRNMGPRQGRKAQNVKPAFEIDKLQEEWSIIQACCMPKQRWDDELKHRPDHPLYNITLMANMRLKRAMQTGDQRRQDDMETFMQQTQSADAAHPERTMNVLGVKLCQTCWYCLLGMSLRTLQRRKRQCEAAAKGVSPSQASGLTSPSASRAPVGDAIYEHIKQHDCQAYGESLPGDNGGQAHTFFQFPFYSLKDYTEQLSTALNMRELSQSTVRRAIQRLEEQDHIRIGLRKTKQFARCTSCVKFDNQLRNAGTPELRKQVQQVKSVHLMQVRGQRDFFTKQTEQAKRQDGFRNLAVLSTDGMDQSKTTLPHRIRYSKETEAKREFALDVHVNSTFMFGSSIPLHAFVNLGELTKNGSLTVSYIARVLEKTFKAAPKDADGKLKEWPRRLHLCFDNAVGENLNKYVFMYLAALVHHGVFHVITVGTLVVGHTHIINDQVFSVWAKRLGLTDCNTLSALMDLLKNNYKAKLKETDQEAEQRRQREAADASAARTASSSSPTSSSQAPAVSAPTSAAAAATAAAVAGVATSAPAAPQQQQQPALTAELKATIEAKKQAALHRRNVNEASPWQRPALQRKAQQSMKPCAASQPAASASSPAASSAAAVAAASPPVSSQPAALSSSLSASGVSDGPQPVPPATDLERDTEAIEKAQQKAKHVESFQTAQRKLEQSLTNKGVTKQQLDSPHVERLEHNVNVDAWLGKDRCTTAKAALQHIGKHHVFAFQKQMSTGDTYLFKKYLHDSELHYKHISHPYKLEADLEHAEKHLEENLVYSQKNLIWAGADELGSDPDMHPKTAVDMANLRVHLLQRFLDEQSLSPEDVKEYAELEEQLNKVLETQDKCATCKRLRLEIQEIGPIRQLKPHEKNDDSAKATYNSKVSKRKYAYKELAAHLEAHSDAHAHLKLQGWWTTWRNVYVPQIQAHYQSRGFGIIAHAERLEGAKLRVVAPAAAEAAMTGLMEHPTVLLSQAQRVLQHQFANTVMERLGTLGAPKHGDIAFIRADEEEDEDEKKILDKPTFWVVKVVACCSPSPDMIAADERRVQYVTKLRERDANAKIDKQCDEYSPQLDEYLGELRDKSKSPEAAAAAAAATAAAATAAAAAASRRSKGKDQQVQTSQEGAGLDGTHMYVLWWDHGQPKQKAAAAVTQRAQSKKRKSTDDDSEYDPDENEGAEDEGAEDSDHEDAAARKRKKPKISHSATATASRCVNRWWMHSVSDKSSKTGCAHSEITLTTSSRQPVNKSIGRLLKLGRSSGGVTSTPRTTPADMPCSRRKGS